MQKVGDTGDISLLFFLDGANFFWPKLYLCYFYYFLHLCTAAPILMMGRKRFIGGKTEIQSLDNDLASLRVCADDNVRSYAAA